MNPAQWSLTIHKLQIFQVMGVSDRDVVYWAVDVSYLAGGYLAVHPSYAWLGRGAPNPQKRGTCLREHVQVVVASRNSWRVFFGWAVSFERCYSGRLAVLGRNGSAWAVLNLICGWRGWNLLGRRRH